MSRIARCDAPDCDAEQGDAGDGSWPWYTASLQVREPVAAPDDGDEHPWGWWSAGSPVAVDACTLEHLRIAMAVKIAELTDEAPAQ